MQENHAPWALAHIGAGFYCNNWMDLRECEWSKQKHRLISLSRRWDCVAFMVILAGAFVGFVRESSHDELMWIKASSNLYIEAWKPRDCHTTDEHLPQTFNQRHSEISFEALISDSQTKTAQPKPNG